MARPAVSFCGGVAKKGAAAALIRPNIDGTYRKCAKCIGRLPSGRANFSWRPGPPLRGRAVRRRPIIRRKSRRLFKPRTTWARKLCRITTRPSRAPYRGAKQPNRVARAQGTNGKLAKKTPGDFRLATTLVEDDTDLKAITGALFSLLAVLGESRLLPCGSARRVHCPALSRSSGRKFVGKNCDGFARAAVQCGPVCEGQQGFRPV